MSLYTVKVETFISLPSWTHWYNITLSLFKAQNKSDHVTIVNVVAVAHIFFISRSSVDDEWQQNTAMSNNMLY